jgi:DNA polymerase III alpha subunit (gram-positive type)
MKDKILIFDTETTGLLSPGFFSSQPNIIQFYGSKFELKDKELIHISDFEQYYKQKEPLPSVIVKVTHITDEQLNQHKAFVEQVDELTEYLKDVKYFCAHNCAFDREILKANYSKAEKMLDVTDVVWQCTMERMFNCFGYRLTEDRLYNYLFNEERTGQHNAKQDVIDLTRIVKELIKREII